MANTNVQTDKVLWFSVPLDNKRHAYVMGPKPWRACDMEILPPEATGPASYKPKCRDCRQTVE